MRCLIETIKLSKVLSTTVFKLISSVVVDFFNIMLTDINQYQFKEETQKCWLVFQSNELFYVFVTFSFVAVC